MTSHPEPGTEGSAPPPPTPPLYGDKAVEPPKREIKYGFRKGVPQGAFTDPYALKCAIDALPEKTVDGLYEDSKRPDSFFKDDLWTQNDQYWAERGRKERCRQIFSLPTETIVQNGKALVTNRSFEYVKPEGEPPRFEHVDTILRDPDLRDSLFAEMQEELTEAANKIGRYRLRLRHV